MRELVKILLVDDDEDDYVMTRAMLAEIDDNAFSLDWVKTFELGLQTMCANGEIRHRELKSSTGLRIRYRISPRCIAEYFTRTTVPVRRT